MYRPAFYLALFAFACVASCRVMRDDQVAGGTTLRSFDRYLSENLDGVHSEHVQNGGEPGMYGKYAEPVLHAMEHIRRGIFHGEPQEFARAYDELRSFGSGLQQNDHVYQDSYAPDGEHN